MGLFFFFPMSCSFWLLRPLISFGVWEERREEEGGGGEAAFPRAFVRAKWSGRATALPRRRAARQEPRDRSEWGYPALSALCRGELGLAGVLAAAPGRRRGTFSPPFPLSCSRRVQERGESSFPWARPRGEGQSWLWGSALAVLMWEGPGAARAAGWSPTPGWSSAAGDAAAQTAVPQGTGRVWSRAAGNTDVAKGRATTQPCAPRAAAPPRTARMQQPHPTHGSQLTRCPPADTSTAPHQHAHSRHAADVAAKQPASVHTELLLPTHATAPSLAPCPR